MLTEVMRHYGLTRPPVEVGFFETEHHAQVARDVRVAIQGGRLIALTAVIGSGKTVLARRLRDEIERKGCESAWKNGSDAISVQVKQPFHAAPSRRARRRSSLARPYI